MVDVFEVVVVFVDVGSCFGNVIGVEEVEDDSLDIFVLDLL